MNYKIFNTFGIEAHAERIVGFADAVDLRASREAFGGTWGVIGAGSNIVLTKDFEGTLFHPTGLAVEPLQNDRVRVQAGVIWDDFVAWSVARGLWGAENLSHIPGTVGAAPVQNIGAYGAEAASIVESVEAYDPVSDKVLTFSNKACEFGYRDSIFKRQLMVILTVTFKLGTTPNPRLDYGDLRKHAGGGSLKEIRDAVIAIRRSKLPDPEEQGSAGSFFKNPIVCDAHAAGLRAKYPDMPLYDAAPGLKKLAAGWLIDRAGWKGRALGRAGVHPGQALVLVNLGGATGADVMALASAIQKDVHEQFGVSIETEVNIW